MISHAVVDSSVAIKWVVEEEDSDSARSIAPAELEAPDLLLIECANVLWKKVALADLNPREMGDRWQLLRQVPIRLTPTLELLDEALRISLHLNYPVYDCVYLALALLRRIPLITADRKLVSAVKRKKTSGLHAELIGHAGARSH